MPTLPRLAALALCWALALAVLGHAQQTWVVDASGGAGAHFTDLPPALAAASDGDILRVRAGSYHPATTSKGVTILGEPGATIAIWQILTPFEITGLAAGKRFAMCGMTISGAMPYPAMAVTACQGRVHLDRLSIDAAALQSSPNPSLNVAGSHQVTITDSTLVGCPALQCSGSTVLVSGSTLRGVSAGRTVGPPYPWAGHPAIRASSATVILSRGSYTGGSGYFDPNYPMLTQPPRPALLLASSQLELTGDSSTVLSAGSLAGYPVHAIEATGSLAIDPGVQLRPSGGATAIGGSATLDSQRIPALTASGAPPGGNVAIELVSPAGDRAELYLSLPADPVAVPPHGTMWLDPALVFFLGATVQGSGEHWSVSIPVPADPILRGIVLRVQGISGTPAGVAFSTPGTFAIH